MAKAFKLAKEEIVDLLSHSGGCLATDRITVDGLPVGYMYREEADRDGDTGWRFFAGDESQGYLDVTSNSDVYEVNTIANYDSAIIPYLDTPAPCAFERVAGDVTFRELKE